MVSHSFLRRIEPGQVRCQGLAVKALSQRVNACNRPRNTFLPLLRVRVGALNNGRTKPRVHSPPSVELRTRVEANGEANR